LFRWSGFTTRYMVLSFGSLSACLGAYKFMSYMATPTFGVNDRGVEQVQDAGLDLNIGSGGLGE
uniref:ADP,ATP carrier protein n=1 Tax=Echinostoma caproni TaxID=27848 RepID=A0A183ATB9_9TREM